MSLITAVLNKNLEKLEILLLENNQDINSTKNTYTALWCAITGTLGRPTIKTNKSSVRLVNKLLQYGADPGLKCMHVPPIYMAIFEERCDILCLLLLAGANPDNYTVISTASEEDVVIARCKLPIIKAIDNADYEAVRLLVKFGAIYNNKLIEKTERAYKKIKQTKRDSFSNREIVKNLKKILKLLHDNYTEDLEVRIKDYLDEYQCTDTYENKFEAIA